MSNSDAPESRQRGRLFVLSGPSGVGKDAVLSALKRTDIDSHFAVTATTRPIRRGEIDGLDYLFLPKAEFERMIQRDEFIEWAEVYGNLYGVPRAQVSNALERGGDVVLKIDVQGAATVRCLYPDAVLVFLEPPDMATLERRLRLRNTESAEALRTKLQTAYREMTEADWFDHRVINEDDRLDATAAAVADILRH